MASSYVKPQVTVFQEYTTAPAELLPELRAHISGPNAQLHRFAEADEKANIRLGAYDRVAGGDYLWPGRTAGSLIDADSVKLFIENALLMYFEDTIGATSGGRGVVTAVAGKKNVIRHSTMSFASNGTAWPRSGLLLDRDVTIGDVVYLRGVVDPESACDEYELWTYVDGLLADTTDATIFPATTDENNAGLHTAAATISQTAGPENCVYAALPETTAYSGLESGFLSETYTIEVVKSSISGCNAARLRITTDSGTDNQEDVEPAAFNTYTDIGTRGLKVMFKVASDECSLSASLADVEAEELVVGQKWTVTVTQAFEKSCVVAGDTYSGSDDDTYIITVTKGGKWSQLPEVTVTTAKGLDSSGPSVVTGVGVSFAVGSYGLTASFSDCGNLGSSSSISSATAELGIGDNALPGLRKGDKFYITVASGQNGPIKSIQLRDDLPEGLLSATDLDLRLFITGTVEVTEQRLSHPPLTNFSVTDTQFSVNPGITAYDVSWTDDGVQQPLLVWDGVVQSTGRLLEFSILYVEYREWLQELVDTLTFVPSIADIDMIPGQLDEDNPLKWHVYRALQNSNGTKVGCTAVSDPDDLDAWTTVLTRLKGRDEIYNLVPVTYDQEVLNLFAAHVEAESSPEAGNWKGMFVGLKVGAEVMIVGKSSADNQLLSPTSADGKVVLAKLDDDPDAAGSQYTRLSVPLNNANFITYGVKPGDTVRFLYTIDGFGTAEYSEFTVDRVLSESTLLLLTGHTETVSVAQKIEIWRSLTRDELVAAIGEQAQQYANSRIVAVWPDVVGTGSNAQDGTALAAALAGLASGVVPHQGLTHVEIAGFDDLASRTKDLFSSSQLDALAGAGVWIATEDKDGTPHTRHALTTDMTDLNHREEMIRRNVDSISYLFLNTLRPYIGRANATPTLLRKLRYETVKLLRRLSSTVYTEELGSQLISGEIAKDSNGDEILRIHPLAADHIEIVLNLSVPAPVNNIELHLVV